MGERLSVSLLQPDLVWENISANLLRLDIMIAQVPGGTGLVLLPETFSTGFTMRAGRFAEGGNGSAVKWMKSVAAERKCTIAGSLIIRDRGGIYNRLFWVTPGGIEGTYDKRHLFRMGREDEQFTPGSARPVFRLGAFRFLPQICYDLRFPVFSRNRNDYDVLFYVANWPAPRQQAWNSLTRARAIENQAYVLGINRVGRDGVGVDHVGGSCAYDPAGKSIQLLDDQEGIMNITLDLQHLKDFRKKFPAWMDGDRFRVEGVD
jgi:omega-amidase